MAGLTQEEIAAKARVYERELEVARARAKEFEQLLAALQSLCSHPDMVITANHYQYIKYCDDCKIQIRYPEYLPASV